MHYLLGLAALVIGAIIATRRTRPTWFVVTTSVLVGVGALLAVLSYTRVTDPMGLVANSVLGWVFVGASIITMLSSIFVLERRGEFGEERPPLIGDNPFDGDTDDSDDPAPGTAPAGVGTSGAAPAGDTAAGTPTRTEESAMGTMHTDDTDHRPGPSEDADDGTTVIGADPDLATPPGETDVDAAPSGDVAHDGDRTHDGHDGTARH